MIATSELRKTWAGHTAVEALCDEVDAVTAERDKAQEACRAVLETYDRWYPDDIFIAYPGCDTGVNDIVRNRQLLRAALSATTPREEEA